MSQDFIRDGVLALAHATGWSKAEIMAMPTAEFLFWLEGCPKQ